MGGFRNSHSRYRPTENPHTPPDVRVFFFPNRYERLGEMANRSAAGKGKSAKSRSDDRAPFVGYVNTLLTEEDREKFEVWSADADLLDETYVEALADGYQFTTKFDAANDTYLCSVSTWDVNKSDAGIIYTGRSSSPAVALSKTLFVLSQKLDWDLANGYVKKGNVDAF